MTYLIVALGCLCALWIGTALRRVLIAEKNLVQDGSLFEDSHYAALCSPTLVDRLRMAYTSRFGPWPPQIKLASDPSCEPASQ